MSLNHYEALISFFHDNFNQYKRKGDSGFNAHPERIAYKRHMKTQLSKDKYDNWVKNYDYYGCNMFDFMSDSDMAIDAGLNPYFV